MYKLYIVRILKPKLFPELPYTKVALTNIGIVKHDHSQTAAYARGLEPERLMTVDSRIDHIFAVTTTAGATRAVRLAVSSSMVQLNDGPLSSG